jgi:hypothetical protein
MTLRLLHLLFSPLKTMTALLDRIVGVIAGFQSREADLRQRLADALADDAADEAEIAAARSDALAAMERAATAEALMAQLQARADDANSQLTAIDAFIEQFVPALTDKEVEAEDETVPAADAVDSSAAAEAGDEADAADGDDSAAAGDAAGDTSMPDQPGVA